MMLFGLCAVAPLHCVGQGRGVFHDPAARRRMIDAGATPGQHLFEVMIGHGATDVEEDCMQDHIPQ